jgi:streptomycin 6-kinase
VRRTDWAASLPATLAAVTQRWSLSVGPPFQHDGGYSWVAPARTATNPDLVLKLGWQHLEAHHEPDGLALWQGNGAIRLHDSLRLNGTTALLLERCRPGTSLRALPEPDQDVVVAGLLRRLWHRPTTPFRPLHTMCDLWATGFDTRRPAGPDPLDPGLARAGRALWLSLPHSAPQTRVLCTDLHAGNILAARREPWLVIDPKPYLGDPAYDVLQHILNCRRLTTDPLALAHRMAHLLDLDRERVRLWLFARCVIESANRPECRHAAELLAP